MASPRDNSEKPQKIEKPEAAKEEEVAKEEEDDLHIRLEELSAKVAKLAEEGARLKREIKRISLAETAPTRPAGRSKNQKPKGKST